MSLTVAEVQILCVLTAIYHRLFTMLTAIYHRLFTMLTCMYIAGNMHPVPGNAHLNFDVSLNTVLDAFFCILLLIGAVELTALISLYMCLCVCVCVCES